MWQCFNKILFNCVSCDEMFSGCCHPAESGAEACDSGAAHNKTRVSHDCLDTH